MKRLDLRSGGMRPALFSVRWRRIGPGDPWSVMAARHPVEEGVDGFILLEGRLDG